MLGGSSSAAVGAILVLAWAPSLRGQAPDGPQTPVPGAQAQQPADNPPTKLISRVTLVNAPVTVRDLKGKMVTSLTAKDFQITDQGVPQTITHFDLGGDPISLVVLYEASSRVEPMFPALQKTGVLISDTVMGPTGEAAIIRFDDSVEQLLGFTTSPDEIQKAVARLKLGLSGSRLYDAMAAGVELLSTRPQSTAAEGAQVKPGEGRRRVMLVVSEARDEGSQAKLGEVLRQAQLANVTIYSVGLSTTRAELEEKPKDNRVQVAPPGTYPLPGIPGAVPAPAENDPRLNAPNIMPAVIWAVTHAKNDVTGNPLELATAGTGGQHVKTFRDRSIENAIDEIGGELHSQYTISYAPTATSSTGFHEIKVSIVTHKGLKVRTRPGYYLASPEN